jgi:hypothetical protein
VEELIKSISYIEKIKKNGRNIEKYVGPPEKTLTLYI